jgi:hypothetical protein
MADFSGRRRLRPMVADRQATLIHNQRWPIWATVNPLGSVEQNGSVHVMFLLNFFDELKRRLP